MKTSKYHCVTCLFNLIPNVMHVVEQKEIVFYYSRFFSLVEIKKGTLTTLFPTNSAVRDPGVLFGKIISFFFSFFFLADLVRIFLL